MADLSAKKGINLKTIMVTGVSVALGLVIFHMVKKHLLNRV